MGNLQFLISPHATVTDTAVTAALTSISTDRFRSQLFVEHEVGWAVWSPGCTREFPQWVLWRATRRKFETKYAFGSDWSRWAQAVVLHQLALRLHLKMADEGIADPPWVVTEQSYQEIATFRRWWELIYVSPLKDEHQAKQRQFFNATLARVPDEWREEANRP